MASVQFNKSFSDYDTGHEVTNEHDNSTELGNIWNKADDKKFGKVIAGKQVLRREASLAYFTLQSQKKFVIADSKDEGDNNSIFKSNIGTNHLLSNQLIPRQIVRSEISSFLTDIFGANTFLPPKIFHDLKKEKDLPELSNIL